MLPDDFWQDFECRLDARITPIEQNIGKIEQYIGKIEQWIKIQDKIFEKENINKVIRFFKDRVGVNVIKPENRIPKNVINVDGIYIMTNDIEYIQNEKNPKMKPNCFYRLLIIEAKQYLSINKYNEKKAQKIEIEKILQNKDEIPSELKDICFENCQHSVLLYFNSNDMDESVNEYILHDTKYISSGIHWIDSMM